MRRIPLTLLALATAVFWLPRTSGAASLSFQAVPAPPATCSFAGCYQVRMFFDDPTRSLSIQALEFSLDVVGGARTVDVPFGTGVDPRANTALENADGDGLSAFPWDVISQIGKQSGPSGFRTPDATLRDGAHLPFTIESMQASRDTFNEICVPTAICTIQSEGLAANRIYLGHFNVLWHDGGVGLRVSGISGTGLPGTDAVEAILGLEGAVLDVAGFPSLVPEPCSAVLLGAGLIALGLRRTSPMASC